MSGMRIVRLVEENICPRDIVTQEMLETAMRVGVSVGGSTNMTLHMPAIAHEAGLKMELDDIERISRETPCIVKVKPSGSHTMWDLEQAGGVGAVLRALDGMVNLDLMTVNGKTLRENAADIYEHNEDVVHSVEHAYSNQGSLAVLQRESCPGRLCGKANRSQR